MFLTDLNSDACDDHTTVIVRPAKLTAYPIFRGMDAVESYQRALSGRQLTEYRTGLIQQSLQQAINLIQKHG